MRLLDHQHLMIIHTNDLVLNDPVISIRLNKQLRISNPNRNDYQFVTSFEPNQLKKTEVCEYN